MQRQPFPAAAKIPPLSLPSLVLNKAMMESSLILPCAHCGQLNRVPSAKLGNRPVCATCHQALTGGKPAELDPERFQKLIQRSDLPVIIDFWAPWCGPCKMMAPEFAKAAASLAGKAILAKLNTQDYPQAAAQFGISGIPTMILFHKGREAARKSGAMQAPQILAWIQSESSKA